jgi:FMN hydrolase / 5-amino-6-(5-phospho-D-ribitylamino)uracil phosphatase
MSISAICFDLDNTLWDLWPAIVRAEQEMYAFLQEQYPRIASRYSVEALRAERERVVADEPHMHYDFTYLRKVSLKRCADAVGYCEPVAEEAFAVFFRARNTVTLYQDVPAALDKLRRRFRLFTLTNGNADLAAIGIDHHFEGRFAARDVGALKPAAAAFKHVLDQTRLHPKEILFVGDDPVADVQGARAAGMKPVWVNRSGALWSAEFGVQPDTVTTLDELDLLLERA